MQISQFYIVVTEFPNEGFGSGGDAVEDKTAAYDQYAECLADDQPARAFHLTFDVETGELETTREVTSDLQDMYERIREERSLEPMAAE